jgi:hypothetical protein
MADFTMYVGDSFVLSVSVVDEAGEPVDITGTTVRWQMAHKVKDILPLVSKTTEGAGGILISDGPGGVFEVTIDPEDTEGFKAKSYYHEAEVDDAGVVSTVMTGTGTLLPTLIRPPPEA